MWLASIFNMLTYTAATSYVADIFSSTSKSMIQGYGLHSTCRWCLLGLHSLDCFRWDFKVYISFTLFTCGCTLIYTLMYCVCQHTDPGMAQIHRGLTRFESGRYTKSTAFPIGICEDVPVVVANTTILTDFVILDIPEDDAMAIILGRPSLNTQGLL